ncbi:MAG: hypothetical protein LBV42_05240 [Methanobrevibacter sp.]|jgi:Na+-driven multidrug efflux pump|nr:hypothetical protein [Methanobrevibacter sp.]
MGKTMNEKVEEIKVDEKTKEVKVLLGDPKKAILKLSGPMIIAMIVMQSYNLIDVIWVAGLGSDAIAAVGFIAPLFLIYFGISNGLGAGATAVISRYIGAENKIQANNSAFHVLILIFIISILTTVIGIIILKPFLLFSGAASVSDLAYHYGVVFIGGSFLWFS